MTGEEDRDLKKFLEMFPHRMGAVLRNARWADEPWSEEDERPGPSPRNG